MLRSFLLALGTVLAVLPAAAAEPEVVADYLQVIADTTFSPEETARIVTAEQRLAKGEPAERQKVWAAAAAFLKRYRGAKLEEQAYLRHRARVDFQLAPQPDPTALRIVAAHDVVVLTDEARREAVTAADLRAIEASDRFVAGMTGIAAPHAGLTPAALVEARQAYASGPVGRMVLTEAQIRDALRQRFWAAMSPSQRGEVAAKIKAAVHRPEDAATAARELEGAFVNAYLLQLKKDAAARQAAIQRAGGGMGDALGRYVAMRRATVNYDAMMMSWSALHY